MSVKTQPKVFVLRRKTELVSWVLGQTLLTAILFAVFAANAFASTNVSFCRNLTKKNEVYVLTQNISSNGTCFNVKARNVTFDCQGYTISYSATNTGYSVYSNGYDRTTVK